MGGAPAAQPTPRRGLASRPDHASQELISEYQRIAGRHPDAIVKFTARSALPPSVTRVFRAGTKKALVELLGQVRFDGLTDLGNETAFRRWFEAELDRVALVILDRNPSQTRPGIHPGYKWGHSTKVLALFVRDVVLRSRYFDDASVTQMSPWLPCPIDGIVIRRLKELGERPAVSSIREIDSAEAFWRIQDRLGAAAAAAGVPRVWFDDVWGDRD